MSTIQVAMLVMVALTREMAREVVVKGIVVGVGGGWDGSRTR